MKPAYLALGVCAALASPAKAADGPFGDIARVDLLPGWQVSETVHMAGIRIRMAEGWHTYWRQPGDAGIPPVLDLSGSEGISGRLLHFPVPDLIDSYGMISVGYEDEVILPLELARTGDIRLQGTLTIGVCEEVCVPMEFAIDAVLPRGGASDAAIAASLAQQPTAAGAQARCSARPIEDGMAIELELPGMRVADARHVVIETALPEIWVSPPVLGDMEGAMTAVADLVPPDARPFMLDRSDVRVTVFAQNAVTEYVGCRRS